MKLIERNKCPVCRSGLSRTLYTEAYSNAGIQKFLISFYSEQGEPDISELNDSIYQLDECLECDLVYQKYVPDDNSLHQLYTKWISFDKAFMRYEKYRSIFRLDSNYSMIRDVCQFLKSRELKCFDYGFGHAHLLYQARIFGMDVYGCELNKIQIEHAKSLGIKIIEFCDETLPKMDVIFCEQVLEHTVDPGSVMNNLVKLSRKGTVLHLSVPDSKNLKKALINLDWNKLDGDRSLIMPFAPLEHLNSFKNENLIQLATSYGFRRINLHKQSIIINLARSHFNIFKNVAHLVKIYKRRLFDPLTTELFFVYEG